MNLIWLVVCFKFSLTYQLYEGDICSLKDDNKGECILVENCDWAINQIQLGNHPQRCTFKGLIPVVCCPISSRNNFKLVKKTAKEIINEKCKEFLKYSPDLKNVHFVEGGVKSLARANPHMALLGFGAEDETRWLCGGSLISNNFVLTAAHCLFHRDHGDVQFVRLGELDVINTTDDADPQDFRIKKTISHPKYAPPSHYHDIALIELDQKVNITDYIKPACIWTEDESNNSDVVVMGWGISEHNGDPNSHLMEAYLNVVNETYCQAKYNNTALGGSRLSSGIDYETQLCAEGSSELRRDTCEGDSGGPLVIRLYVNRHYVFGITSFGKPCGVMSSPGVYTRVPYYMQWIVESIWPELL